MSYGRHRRRVNGPDSGQARAILQGLGSAGIPTYREAMAGFASELRRSRRYERPLVLVLIAPELVTTSALAPAGDRGLECMLFMLFGALLRDVTRENDLPAYVADEHVYALCMPETAGDGAGLAAWRIARAYHARTNQRMRFGMAEFPGQGLTVDALFEHALRALAQAPALPFDQPEPAPNEPWAKVASAR